MSVVYRNPATGGGLSWVSKYAIKVWMSCAFFCDQSVSIVAQNGQTVEAVTYLFRLLHQSIQGVKLISLLFGRLLQLVVLVPELFRQPLRLVMLHAELDWIGASVDVPVEALEGLVRSPLRVPEILDFLWIDGFLEGQVVDGLEVLVPVGFEDSQPLVDVPLVVWMWEMGQEKARLDFVKGVEVSIEPSFRNINALVLELIIVLCQPGQNGLLFKDVFLIRMVVFVRHCSGEQVERPGIDTEEEHACVEAVIVLAGHPVDVLEIRRWLEDLKRDFLVHNDGVCVEIAGDDISYNRLSTIQQNSQ
jgi:hypothetical protein